MDAFLCFMLFPLKKMESWWKEGLHGGSCQPAAAIPALNQEWESIHVQEEQSRCCWWKEDVDGTIEKLYDADPSAARAERSQKKQNSKSSCSRNIWAPTLTLWVLWDGRNKLHGPIGWRTCLMLPVKSRGSPRSHIRGCWSSSRELPS